MMQTLIDTYDAPLTTLDTKVKQSMDYGLHMQRESHPLLDLLI